MSDAEVPQMPLRKVGEVVPLETLDHVAPS